MILPRILTQKSIDHGLISEEDREIYEYGFEITIYTIWSTIVLLLIGLALRQLWASLIIVALFYTFQSTGGGYHADTHLKCLSTLFPLGSHATKPAVSLDSSVSI